MLIRYEQDIHTTEARNNQIDAILGSTPELLVVGSVGRHALIGQDISPNKDGFARDIDVTAISSSVQPTMNTFGPFPKDHILQGLIDVVGSTATVCYRADRPDVAVTMPSEVFEPYPITIGSMRCFTFHPDTLLNIHRIVGTYNPRVEANIKQLRVSLQTVDYAHIPSDRFEAFRELQQLALKDPELRKQKLLEQLMALYDYFAPAAVRSSLQPITAHILDHLKAESRNGMVVPKS